MLYPYFAEIAYEHNEDLYALRVCDHLLASKFLMREEYIVPFLQRWNTEYATAACLNETELLWALNNLHDHISAQVDLAEIKRKQVNSTRNKLRVINGGLSDKPDRPVKPFEDLRYSV